MTSENVIITRPHQEIPLFNTEDWMYDEFDEMQSSGKIKLRKRVIK